MQKTNSTFRTTASDLVAYLNCRHLTTLDRHVAEGTREKPKFWDPLAEILWQRGQLHEKAYVDHLNGLGLEIATIEGVDVTQAAVDSTLAAMKSGTDVIVQGALVGGTWVGRADILRRVEIPSDLGAWSYEAFDTKLARDTRAGSVLQLCLYSDLLEGMQGRQPQHMHVVVPWTDFQPESYRYLDYAAYYRRVKNGLAKTLSVPPSDTYPNPIEHCEICRWRAVCDKQRRTDDHPSLVAGISKLQIGELKHHNIPTMAALAAMPLPLSWKPDRGSADSYKKVREQARVQVQARTDGQKVLELLPPEASFGLARLPQPSQGDIFLDLEGDPFVGAGGLEYLFGYVFHDETSEPHYEGKWALSRADEKRLFEEFVDFAIARLAKFPDLHIYHYAPYEQTALKRLMGRYATREDQIDRLLRGKAFVDLFQVVRESVRASVESYSIKKLEPFYGFERATSLGEANIALTQVQSGLELDDIPSISEDAKAKVVAYNKDDCLSATSLRQWLENFRTQQLNDGAVIERPKPGVDAPSEQVTDWIVRVTGLIEKLTDGIPADSEQRNDEQRAKWLLASVLDWHRRENKAVWWEYFRLADLSADDLLDERAAISGLTFVANVGGTVKAPIHRYKFLPQETEIRDDKQLHCVGGAPYGHVHAISLVDSTIDIKKRMNTANLHAPAVFAHKVYDGKVMAEALARIAEYVIAHGINGDGPYLAARDLLLAERPRLGGEPIRMVGEDTDAAAVRLCGHLAGGILPIQGPPGSGKTFTGALMICALVKSGKKVGITANSHKVIRNLIDETILAADKQQLDFNICQKADEFEEPQGRLNFAKKPEDLLAALDDELRIALGTNSSVGGGTAWLWSRLDAAEKLDVLFVDEAAQMSLANVLAVSQAAKTVVLIGDPQQLDQPTKSSHPEGADSSALDHILGGESTIAPDQGLFLEQTWRLHPEICAFTSELFYENKLRPRPGLEKQVIKSTTPLNGHGLRYIPVAHSGNQNSSPEEADVIKEVVQSLLNSDASWIDRYGKERPLTMDDIRIITPYNAQVFEILQRLPTAKVGTVDKFQGQQAPIAIYSTASSSQADAPRGMNFLYSANRLNVATSRAKCLSVLVGSPRLFECECKTPVHVRLANGLCRFSELSLHLFVPSANG